MPPWPLPDILEQDPASLTIPLLISNYQSLCNPSHTDHTLDIEEQKLRMLHLFECIILKDLPAEYALKAPLPPAKHPSLNHTLKILLYYFLLLFGLFENIAGSYLFGSALFSMIPAISNPILIGASVLFTLLSSLLFYAFEVTFLKDALGIRYTNNEFTKMIELYSQQIKITTNINHLLATMHMHRVNPSTYHDYLSLLKLLNQDLRDKKHRIDTYPQSILKSIIKVSIIAFGALSSIAGSCFMVNSLINLLAPTLINTPIEWSLLCLTVLAGLGFYYAMDTTSMVRLVNPSFDEFHTLKNDLQVFTERYHDDLSEVKTIKQGFLERVPTRTCGTQTQDVAPIRDRSFSI